MADRRRRETDNVISDNSKVLYSEGNEYYLDMSLYKSFAKLDIHLFRWRIFAPPVFLFMYRLTSQATFSPPQPLLQTSCNFLGVNQNTHITSHDPIHRHVA